MNQQCTENVYNVYHFINHSCCCIIHVLAMHLAYMAYVFGCACDVSRKCVHYYMYTNLLYELVLVGMKGKYGTCKVTTGNDVCVCLLRYKSYHVVCTPTSGAICM